MLLHMAVPRVSFEFFPPSDPENEARLRATVERLAPLRPHFVSVTYGADGSTRDRTHRIVSELHGRGQLRVAPHLTCVDASREEVLTVARSYWEMGIRHIVALRGDPPVGTDPYVPRSHGFGYAVELVRATRPNDASAPDFVKNYVNFGASVRAAQFIVLSAKARALSRGRYNVAYEDITALAIPVLRHRILLNFHAESERVDSDEILRRLLANMPPPKAGA